MNLVFVLKIYFYMAVACCVIQRRKGTDTLVHWLSARILKTVLRESFNKLFIWVAITSP